MKIGSIMAYSTDAAGNKTIEPVFEKISMVPTAGLMII